MGYIIFKITLCNLRFTVKIIACTYQENGGKAASCKGLKQQLVALTKQMPTDVTIKNLLPSGSSYCRTHTIAECVSYRDRWLGRRVGRSCSKSSSDFRHFEYTNKLGLVKPKMVAKVVSGSLCEVKSKLNFKFQQQTYFLKRKKRKKSKVAKCEPIGNLLILSRILSRNVISRFKIQKKHQSQKCAQNALRALYHKFEQFKVFINL